MRQLTPSQKGAIAEAAITAAAIELGLIVLRPLCEGSRYDLMIDLEPRLLRVQCKLAQEVEGAIVVRLHTSRYTPGGYVFTTYDASEIDAIGAFAPQSRRCYLIPIAETRGQRRMHLRVDAARNSQVQGITWASDYRFDDAIERLRHDQASVASTVES